MITRNVTLKLRPNSALEFTSLIANEIIPLLRKQKGFRDEITSVARERSEAVSSSFWDTREDAEAYNRTGYQEVLKTMSRVVEGTPQLETFDVSNSTFYAIAAHGV